MLGNFEYFYDDDGRFVFQKKRIYIDESFNNILLNGDGEQYTENAAYMSASEYTFEGNRLISSFSNSPNLNNVRNDYSIWGTRKSVTGNEVPVHLRYAIDKKPVYYKTLEINEDVKKELMFERKITDPETIKTKESRIYYTSESMEKPKEGFEVDWREIIYQMAIDYRKYNDWSSFALTLDRTNRLTTGEVLYPGGYSGYQQYYTDLEGFWRQLYNPHIAEEKEEKIIEINNLLEALEEKYDGTNLKDIQEEIELKEDDLSDENKNNINKALKKINEYEAWIDKWAWSEDDMKNYWAKVVLEAPKMLNFWFDFMNIDGELAQFSVPVIGNRPKAINDKDVKAIYFKETPTVIFVKTSG